MTETHDLLIQDCPAVESAWKSFYSILGNTTDPSYVHKGKVQYSEAQINKMKSLLQSQSFKKLHNDTHNNTSCGVESNYLLSAFYNALNNKKKKSEYTQNLFNFTTQGNKQAAYHLCTDKMYLRTNFLDRRSACLHFVTLTTNNADEIEDLMTRDAIYELYTQEAVEELNEFCNEIEKHNSRVCDYCAIALGTAIDQIKRDPFYDRNAKKSPAIREYNQKVIEAFNHQYSRTTDQNEREALSRDLTRLYAENDDIEALGEHCKSRPSEKDGKYCNAELWNLAAIHYNKRNFINAFKAINYVDEFQNPKYELLRGMMYLKGQGTEKNDKLALKAFLNASRDSKDEGYSKTSEINYYIGQAYYNMGKFPKAKKYFLRSAHCNNALAQQMLGMMFYKGEGGKTNLPEAYAWFSISSPYLYEYFDYPEEVDGFELSVHHALETIEINELNSAMQLKHSYSEKYAHNQFNESCGKFKQEHSR